MSLIHWDKSVFTLHLKEIVKDHHKEDSTALVGLGAIMNIGQQLDRGEEVIFGQTSVELEQLLAQWESKCELNQGEQWQLVRQLLTEIKVLLAQRPMRGRGHCRGQMRHGLNPNFYESEDQMSS